SGVSNVFPTAASSFAWGTIVHALIFLAAKPASAMVPTVSIVTASPAANSFRPRCTASRSTSFTARSLLEPPASSPPEGLAVAEPSKSCRPRDTLRLHHFSTVTRGEPEERSDRERRTRAHDRVSAHRLGERHRVRGARSDV